MNELYLERQKLKSNAWCISVSGTIALFVLKYCETPSFGIHFLDEVAAVKPSSSDNEKAATYLVKGTPIEVHVPCRSDQLSHGDSGVAAHATLCKLPAVVKEGGYYVLAGLGAVLRRIVKVASREHGKNQLLNLLVSKQIAL